jgi:LmbE family N-acetylglucosaminyl deacetylase
MIIFLSPHFDDAIGSAGGMIARLVRRGRACSVMTLMAKPPKIAKVRSFIYVLRRIIENRRACRVVGATVINAPFLDAPYRKSRDSRDKKSGKRALFTSAVTETELVASVRAFILAHTAPGDILIAPAGLGNHVDHLIVRAAVENIPRAVCFYEEFYYDISDPNAERTRGYEKVLLTPDELDIKIRAMEKYKKTLRNLFRKNTMGAMRNYYEQSRVSNGRPYEKFDKVDGLK